ncbi:MAG TPA: extracellular solute-binding protein [Chloroflexota bacterium]|nr:extracellular solute-binding protein [Chloroflexota bacterium]
MTSDGVRTKPARLHRLSRRAWLRAVVGAFGASAATSFLACASPRDGEATESVTRAGRFEPAPPATTPAPAVKNLATLRFWTQWSGHTRQVWESLIGEFEQAHPSIAIASSFFSLADLQRSVFSAAATRTLPDLWINAAMVPPELILDGDVASLNSLGPVPTDFYPAANPASVRAGQRWAVPNNGGVPVFWYNVDRFQVVGLDPNAPPRTWDDLLQYGKALTDARDDIWGLIVPDRHYPWTTECWYGFLLQAGGDLFAPDQRTITFADQPGVEALTFWASLFQTQKTAPLQTFDADTLISTYGTGTIGMFPMYSVEAAHIKSFPFPTRNTPYPTFRRQGAHFAGDYTTISAKSRLASEAYTWCAWWWQPEINAAWCAGTGGLPSRVSSTNYPMYQKFLAREPLIKASLDSLPFARALPSIPGILEIEQRLSESIYAACFGYKSPKQALDDAVPAVYSVLVRHDSFGHWA